MILEINLVKSYLSYRNSRNRASDQCYLSKKWCKFNNGPVFTLSTIIRHVMASASEKKTSIYVLQFQEINTHETDIEITWTQEKPQLLLVMNHLIVSQLVRWMKRSNSMSMRFHWLKFKKTQNKFSFLRRPEKYRENCHNKNFKTSHHVEQRKKLSCKQHYRNIKNFSQANKASCQHYLTSKSTNIK